MEGHDSLACVGLCGCSCDACEALRAWGGADHQRVVRQVTLPLTPPPRVGVPLAFSLSFAACGVAP